MRVVDGSRSSIISIHALLAESDRLGLLGWLRVLISIHALLAESDFVPGENLVNGIDFYPRSPCGERRPPSITPTARRNFYPRSPCGERLFDAVQIVVVIVFLSTLSLRRATACRGWIEIVHYFYPRSPCGERRPLRLLDVVAAGISIHALLAESDSGCLLTMDTPNIFLSTLSLRRATIQAQ